MPEACWDCWLQIPRYEAYLSHEPFGQWNPGTGCNGGCRLENEHAQDLLSPCWEEILGVSKIQRGKWTQSGHLQRGLGVQLPSIKQKGQFIVVEQRPFKAWVVGSNPPWLRS